MIAEAILVGLVLSIDSFSAALAMGHRPFTNKDALKFALSSGIAEGIVALFGALAGAHIITKFAAIDHWIAFGLLMAIALHMAFEGFQNMNQPAEVKGLEFHTFTKILIVSLATSLDAFGVGIGLGISNKPLYLFTPSIAFWAFATTLIGLYLARKLSNRFGSAMSIVGSIILAIMAFQMLKI